MAELWDDFDAEPQVKPRAALWDDFGQPPARPAVPNAPLGTVEVGPITTVSEAEVVVPDGEGGFLGDIASAIMRPVDTLGRIARPIARGIVDADYLPALQRGGASMIASGAQTLGDFLDRTIANPLPQILDAAGVTGVPDAVRDPLGARAMADENMAVARAIAQDRAAAMEAIGQPGVADFIANPSAALAAQGERLATMAAESAPQYAAALATRNPRLGAGILGGTAGAQTYTDLLGEGASVDDAIASALLSAGVETAGAGAALPNVMRPGRYGLPGAILAEAAEEAPVELAQTNLADVALGRETPIAEQIRGALEAGLVGGMMGAGGYTASNAPSMLRRDPQVAPEAAPEGSFRVTPEGMELDIIGGTPEAPSVDPDADLDALLLQNLPEIARNLPPEVAALFTGEAPTEIDAERVNALLGDPSPAAPSSATETPTPADSREGGAAATPDPDVLGLRQEIGWATRGGELVRGQADASTMSEEEMLGIVAQPKGAVTGRTKWVGKPTPGGEESLFWRNRPDKISEAQASAAFDKYERGEPLTKREARFIDYARDVADEYRQDERRAMAEVEAVLARVDPVTADLYREGELTLEEVAAQAREVERFNESPEQQFDDVPFARRGADDRTADLLGGPAPRAESAPQRQAPSQTGLFGAPSAREFVDAAQRTRDARRNGEGLVRTDMQAGGGELFAGPRPQQASVDQPATAAAGQERQPTSGTPRDAGTVPESTREQRPSRLGGESGVPRGLPAEPTADTDSLAQALNRYLQPAEGNEARFAAVRPDSLPDALSGALAEFGRATGTRVVVLRNLNPAAASFNGVSLRDGVLYVDETAEAPVTTVAAHEFVHQLRRDNPEAFLVLTEEVRRQGRIFAWMRELGRRAERDGDATTDYDTAVEELTADAVGDAMTNREFLEELGRRNPTVFRQVVDAFVAFLDRLLGRGRNLGSNAYLRDVRKFRDTLLEVLAQFQPGQGARPQSAPVFSRTEQSGEAEAERLGLRAAVDEALQGRGPQVEFLSSAAELPDRLRTGVERRSEQRGGRGRTAALYDTAEQRVYLFTDVIRTPDRAVWNALHEIAGHHGLRSLLGDRLDNALDLALQNDTVRKVADEIARERNLRPDQRFLAAEEALAELSAAVQSGNYAEITTRYGVDVPEGIQNRLASAVRNFLRRLKAMMDDIFTRHNFSDEDVRELLEAAWQAVDGNAPMQAGDGLDAVDRSERPFFSAALRAIEEGRGAPRRGDAAAWRGWLDGAVRRGDMKQAERDWLGIDDWLAQQGGPVTREALAAFVRANEVQVQDVVLQGKDSAEAAIRDAFRAEGWEVDSDAEGILYVDPDGDVAGYEGLPASLQRVVDDASREWGETKFGSYQLPGGENYRELLLTLPGSTANDDLARQWFQKPYAELTPSESDFIIREAKTEPPKGEFRSSHFDQPNILAHVRFNERTDADGNRVLLIEEIQSDWHQAGRKRGYRDGSIGKEWADAGYGVPDAPFKATDEWAMLAFKRMVRWAAENGFDRVAWTTGEQQAARYDLSKQVSEVEYVDGQRLIVRDLKGSVIHNEITPADKLADVIGKDPAENLLAAPSRRGGGVSVQRISGDGLKVGGGGMRAFYDKILPSAVNKWAKRFGGRVGRADLSAPGVDPYMVQEMPASGQWAVWGGDGIVSRHPTQAEAKAEADRLGAESRARATAMTAHAIDITSPMREAALEGLPMFSRRTRAEAERDAEGRRDEAAGTLPQSRGAAGWSYDEGRWLGRRGQAERATARLQDKMIAWRDVQGQIAEQVGQAIPDAQNVYRLENLMHGRVSDGIDKIEREQVEPLVKAMQAAGVKPAELETYLYARHARERNEQIARINPAMPDGGSGMTTAEAQTILADADTAKLAPLAKQVDRMVRATRKRLLDAGLVTQEAFDAMAEQYDAYVPLRGKRVDETDFDNAGSGAGRGLDTRRNPVQEALGRGAGNRAQNILGEIIGDAQRSVILSEKARVGRAVMRLVLAHPNPALWQVEPVLTERRKDASGEVYEAVVNDWSDPSIIAVKHRGQVYRVQINSQPLAQALNNVGIDQLGAVTRAAGAINRYFSAILTKYNPAFVPVNASRDALFGMVGLASEHGEAAALDAAIHYPQAARAAFRQSVGKAPANEWDRWAREFAEAGGKTGYVAMPSAEDLARKIGTGRMTGYSPTGLSRAARGIADAVGSINDAVENALRLSAFVTLRKRGMSAEAAAAYAKDLTVNFNRKGYDGSRLNAWFLFYNAAIQGAKRVGDVMRKPKAWTYIGSLAAVQAISAMYAMGLEDEEGEPLWNKVPDHVKRRNIVLVLPPKGGSVDPTIVTIPMPYGLNVFTYMAGRVPSAIVGPDDKKLSNRAGAVTGDVLAATAESFFPVPIGDGALGWMPTVLRIPTNIQVNRNDFGRQIRKENPFGRFDVPRASMGRPDTLEVFKMASQGLNRIGGGDEYTPPPMTWFDVAPEDIEYLLGELTGGMGNFVIDMATLTQQATGGMMTPPLKPRDIPITKRFVSNIDDQASQNAMFYERRDVINRSLERVRDTYEREGLEAANALLAATPELTGAAFRLRKVDSKNGKAGSVIESDGRPQIVVSDEGAVFGRYKVAEDAVRTRSEAVRNRYSNTPASILPTERTRMRDAYLRNMDKTRQAVQAEFNGAWTRDVVGSAEPGAPPVEVKRSSLPESRRAEYVGIGEGGRATPAPAVLKGAKNAPRVVMVGSWEGLPEPVRAAFDNGADGAFDPTDKTVYVAMGMPEKDAAFVAYHEVAGHYGLQGALGDDYEAVLNRAMDNPTVKKLADAMLTTGYGDTPNRLARVEEALAELAAARRTGDYDRLERQRGVKIPAAARPGVEGMLSRVVQLTKRKVADLVGDEPRAFNDEQVYGLIEDAWKHVERAPE